MSTQLKVGDRFTQRSARTYTEGGQKHTHRLVLLCEVTGVTDFSFTSRTVEVIDEQDAPSTFDPFRAATSEMAWFGWDAAVARGDVHVVGGR